MVHGLNRYGVTVNNAVALVAMLFTIHTSIPLSVNPNYVRQLSWFQRNFRWLRWVTLGVSFAISLVLSVVSFGAMSWQTGLLLGAIVAGVAIGGLVGGFTGGNGGGWCWDSAVDGMFIGASVAMLAVAVVNVVVAVGTLAIMAGKAVKAKIIAVKAKKKAAIAKKKANALASQQSLQVKQQSSNVDSVARDVADWLGSDFTVITNKHGDKIFMSKDGLRKFRADLINPHPHTNQPHVHFQVWNGQKWVNVPGGRVFPTGI